MGSAVQPGLFGTRHAQMFLDRPFNPAVYLDARWGCSRVKVYVGPASESFVDLKFEEKGIHFELSPLVYRVKGLGGGGEGCILT